ncbi:hypothetical protein [Paractinoplanes toevensis]|uniref:Uncharacterized protein n=1 Tax=Paractinoplanes toevensis TaxID=571911 RepID=A0A919T5K8_9ACTN|nr:hypothetical protein [Actinoplanes toevensis]GIM88782.1 hypothetical protein Ato02nite_005750 [Actinoplanes toevensis]
MKLCELIAALTEIERAGFGDSRVIDDNGNDVMEAVRPVSLDGPVGADSDAAAVMLHCYIDYKQGA